MTKKSVIVVIVVLASLTVATGLGVLIWWLVTAGNVFETILLNGDIGNVTFTAALTRVASRGDMFWWFYPSVGEEPTSRPIILWLHGVTGEPPSFLANFGSIGPYDTSLNRREDSWLNDYNIIFVDAPLGTGFSTNSVNDLNDMPDLNENVDHLMYTLQSFYNVRREYRDTPVYILGIGDGAQLAVPLALEVLKGEGIPNNLNGIFLGNPMISPALTLTRLGFYLEELGYIDGNGRNAIEDFSNLTNTLVAQGEYENAFDQFVSLGDYVNENAGAIAVNLRHIVEKLTQNSLRDYFGEKSYIKHTFRNVVPNTFMQNTIAPALGMPSNVRYDEGREVAIEAFKRSYMRPIKNEVEEILENSDIKVVIFNGNLDAVCNTPGQLEWVDNLDWSGQADYLNRSRSTFIINRTIEGYFREADRLQFYWINVAGHWIQIDNPVAMKRMLDRVTRSTVATS